jgi:hypothetical protein
MFKENEKRLEVKPAEKSITDIGKHYRDEIIRVKEEIDKSEKIMSELKSGVWTQEAAQKYANHSFAVSVGRKYIQAIRSKL